LGFGLQTVIDDIHTQLAGFGTWLQGANQLSAQVPSPRWVWVTLGGPTDPPLAPGADPQPIGTRHIRCEVHCWGGTYEEAELMQAALLTAIREQGNGMIIPVGERDIEPNTDDGGYVIVQTFDVDVMVPRMVLPLTGTPTQLRGTYARINQANLEPVTDTPGDGELDADNE